MFKDLLRLLGLVWGIILSLSWTGVFIALFLYGRVLLRERSSLVLFSEVIASIIIAALLTWMFIGEIVNRRKKGRLKAHSLNMIELSGL